MTDCILFLDANTLWHRRLADALGVYVPTIAFRPHAGLIPRSEMVRPASGETIETPLVLPKGWGSILAPLVQPILGRRLLRNYNGNKSVAVLTSPAWHSLARYMRKRMPYVYYCADDYRSYEGWGDGVAAAEAEICQGAHLSVFVSETLRARAVSEYGLDTARTFISPNATEPRFAETETEAPPAIAGLKRPILGVLGALSDRLDLALIRKASQNPAVGTLLVAGPVQDKLAGESWLSDSKVHVTGRIPHERMHEYALTMDAALVPYASNDLNYHCSPMRLFDHLATGVPIFGNESCHQLLQFADSGVIVRPSEELPDAISAITPLTARRTSREGIFWSDRASRLADEIRAAVATPFS